MHICRKTCAPGHVEVQRTAVGELPRILVVLRLQQVAYSHIVEGAVESHLVPVATIACLQTFTEIEGSCGIPLGQRHRINADISHVVVISALCEGVDVPVAGAVNGSVEHQRSIHLPVAVDVVGL